MNKLNRELINKRCLEISDSLERLEKIKDSSKEEFLKNRDLQDITSYRLLVAIEAALNMCYHVSARKLKKAPDQYAECFGILGEAGIIPEELAKELKNMARFRNMLVHMYWKMDYEIIFDILQNNLEQLRQFAKAIIALL
jgi:uncharacterized protein YutE (UPF0331/DUF86 family)